MVVSVPTLFGAPEERREDGLDVSLATPDRVAGVPCDPAGVETVCEFLEEARPLVVHPSGQHGGGHRLIRKLLDGDRLAEKPPERRCDVVRRALSRSGELDDSRTASALGEPARRGEAGGTRSRPRECSVRAQEGPKNAL